MKKFLLIMMAFMASFIVYAGNESTKSESSYETKTEKEVNSTYYNIFRRVTLKKSDITLPLVIQVAAPSETVIGISGPVTPNVPNWNVSNGMLTITYTEESQIFDLREGGIYYIEVPTTPMMYYAIELTVE